MHELRTIYAFTPFHQSLQRCNDLIHASCTTGIANQYACPQPSLVSTNLQVQNFHSFPWTTTSGRAVMSTPPRPAFVRSSLSLATCANAQVFSCRLEDVVA